MSAAPQIGAEEEKLTRGICQLLNQAWIGAERLAAGPVRDGSCYGEGSGAGGVPVPPAAGGVRYEWGRTCSVPLHCGVCAVG